MIKDIQINSKTDLQSDTPIVVCAAWPYVNGKIHVGHLVGYFLPADIFARYNRLKGRPVMMVSGSDCYGTPITVEADKTGKSPQEIVDIYHPQVLQLIETLRVKYELYTTTTSLTHKRFVQDLFINLAKNGFISKKVTKQYYSETEKKFLPDRYVEGKCPVCGFEESRADECDHCGTKLIEGQLINPISKLTKTTVVLSDTEHYFLDLNKLQSELEKYVEDKDFWREWVIAETKGWLKQGLEGRSITRDLDWGISIPQDALPQDLKLENVENKRFYVWFDAVIGYLSASVEYSEKTGIDWKKYWINPNARHYYFMGKDNLFFHTLWLPGILIGANMGYELPYMVSVCQWLNLNSQKFSKSRGIVLYPEEVVDKYGLDALRYYLTSIFPENHDTNWSWEEFITTNNNELVANLGNFIHRVLIFYKNNPELDLTLEEHSNVPMEDFVSRQIIETYKSVGALVEDCKFSEALKTIMVLSAFGNKYLNDNEPWKQIKISKLAAATSIYNCLTIIENLKILLYPILPTAADKLNSMLGYADTIVTIEGKNQWQYRVWDHNQEIEAFIEPLFTKIDISESC